MKIALLGYGKMGKAIEGLLSEYGHTCVGKFNSQNLATIETLSQADVAIEFSSPEQCSENIALCFEANVPVVVGTTAWYAQYDEVISKMKSNNALLSATNFSIGVQITFHLNKELARVMSKFITPQNSTNPAARLLRLLKGFWRMLQISAHGSWTRRIEKKR
jgi:4-hydroxy-tetrahydrodipicolinate reductase